MEIRPGNVGTGKSTLSNRLANKYSFSLIECDKIGEKSKTPEQYIKEVIVPVEKHMMEGRSVIVDGNNLSESIRIRFLNYAKRYHLAAVCINFGKGDPHSLQIRLDEAKGLSSEEWHTIHDENQNEYVKPSIEEGFDTIFDGQELL